MDFTKPFIYLSAAFGAAIVLAALINGYSQQTLVDMIGAPHARLLFFLGMLLICFVASLFALFYFWSFSVLRMIHSLVAVVSLMLLMAGVSAFGVMPIGAFEFKMDSAGYNLNFSSSGAADPELSGLIMTWGLGSIVAVILTLSAVRIFSSRD